MPSPDSFASIAASIVTYNPDIDRLRANIQGVVDQVGAVFLFDNNSNNIANIRALVQPLGSVYLEEAADNRGIATALATVAASARRHGFDWLLTLDQDSVVPPGMVESLASHRGAHVGLIAPVIADVNKDRRSWERDFGGRVIERFTRAASKGAITSGALTNLTAVEQVGGYDERFFIDYVDYDLNQRLLDANYELLRDNAVVLQHEVGKAKPTWLFTPRRQVDGSWAWERFYSFGHSPSRCYYKARNRVLYTRKHWRTTLLRNEGIVQIPQQVLLTFLFEHQKMAKLKEFARGMRDGFVEKL